MDVEAVLLTGGASRRMGHDKASLLVDGTTLAERTAGELLGAGYGVTVLGQKQIQGCSFLADEEEYQGPLIALARFSPTKPWVFVASCDMPLFDSRVVALLREKALTSQAVVLEIAGHLQPLCSLYASSIFGLMREAVKDDERSIMRLIKSIDCQVLSEKDLADAGISPLSVTGVNTPEELQQLLSKKT